MRKGVSLEENGDRAGERDGGTGEADPRGGGEVLDGDADADAGKVEGSGGEGEPGRVGEAGRGERHFGAVRVAMEKPEGGDENKGGGEGDANGEADEESEDDHGREDGGFDERNGKSLHSEEGGGNHCSNESDGDGPEGAAAELGGPESDGDHGEKVVETEEGMEDAVRKPGGVAVSGVGVGERGEREQDERGGGRNLHLTCLMNDGGGRRVQCDFGIGGISWGIGGMGWDADCDDLRGFFLFVFAVPCAFLRLPGNWVDGVGVGW